MLLKISRCGTKDLSSQGAFNLSNDLASNTSSKVKKLDEEFSAIYTTRSALDYLTKENT